MPSLPVWFLADGARSATRVGTANLVTPAATVGAVWLTSYPPASDPDTAAADGAGGQPGRRAAGPPVRLPTGYVIYQATDRGLLLAPVSQPPGSSTFKLWNPADPQRQPHIRRIDRGEPGRNRLDAAVRRRVPSPTARLGNRQAGRGRAARGEFRGRRRIQSKRGSPRAPVELRRRDGGALATRLEVASAASGRLTAVPGTSASSDALVGFGSPTSGETLVAEFFFPAKVQLASWHPGATRLAVAVIRPGQDQDSLVVG